MWAPEQGMSQHVVREETDTQLELKYQYCNKMILKPFQIFRIVLCLLILLTRQNQNTFEVTITHASSASPL